MSAIIPVGKVVTQQLTTYSTNFTVAESPLSYGGIFRHPGASWTNINTAGNVAYGTQTGFSGGGGYDDSLAWLSNPFTPNQECSGVIHKDPALVGCCHEFEMLLRFAGFPGSSGSPNIARGYECGVAHDGQYYYIVRWNGPYGDFTQLVNTGPCTVNDGSVIHATAVGSTITLFLDGNQLAQVVDSTWADGSPGLGIFHRNAASTTMGYTSYTATQL